MGKAVKVTPAFRDLSTSMAALHDAQAKSVGPKYDAAATLLENLAHAYILNAFFVDMAWTPAVGEVLSLTSFMRDHKLSRDHKALVGSFLRRLEGPGGFLVRVGLKATVASYLTVSACGNAVPEWKVTAPAPARTDIRRRIKTIFTELTLKHPEVKAETLFLCHIGSQLYSCLKGATSGIGLLFPPSDSPDAKFGATAFYENSGLMRKAKVNYMETALVQLVQAHAGGERDEPVRILEIGAGTGGTTLPVLEKLVKNCSATKIHYTFTDISSFFVTKAKPRFEKLFPSVEFEFKLLDVETDPVPQGFTPGSFDIVMVADVLHATQYLDDTVAHTRRLMKPGAVLVLGEPFDKLGLLDVTFGLTDGWWRFADALREGSPLMGTEKWVKFLKEQGFVDAFAVKEHGMGVVFALADDS